VVEGDEAPVARRVHVGLEVAVTHVHRLAEGRDRVLPTDVGRVGGAAPVGHADREGVGEVREVRGPAHGPHASSPRSRKATMRSMVASVAVASKSPSWGSVKRCPSPGVTWSSKGAPLSRTASARAATPAGSIQWSLAYRCTCTGTPGHACRGAA